MIWAADTRAIAVGLCQVEVPIANAKDVDQTQLLLIRRRRRLWAKREY